MLKKIKMVVLSFILILSGGYLLADVPVIELKTEAITEINFEHGLSKYWGAGEKAFIYDRDIIEIDTTTLEQRRLNEKTEFGYIKGRYDDDLIVIRIDKEKQSNRVSYYRYNAETDNYIPLPKINQDELEAKAVGGRIDFQRIFVSVK